MGLTIEKLYPLFGQGCDVQPRTQSSRPALAEVGFPLVGAPSLDKLSAKPTSGYVSEYVIWALLIARTEEIAEASFADIRDFSMFGIAMAAITKMIATTMSSSISENPRCFMKLPGVEMGLLVQTDLCAIRAVRGELLKGGYRNSVILPRARTRGKLPKREVLEK
jgi:hypothetical protein